MSASPLRWLLRSGGWRLPIRMHHCRHWMQERVAAEVRQGWEWAVAEQRSVNLASRRSSDVHASPPSRRCRAHGGDIVMLLARTRCRPAQMRVSVWLRFWKFVRLRLCPILVLPADTG